MALREKLREIKQAQSGAATDRKALLSDWRKAVDTLFKRIHNDLSDYEKEGLIAFKTQPLSRSEEQLGDYVVDMLELGMGPHTVIALPVGRFVIGAAGRVDVYRQGRVSEGYMLLRTKPEGDVWSIAKKENPLQAEPLTKAALEKMIENLLS
jgi:hypothetical protein